MSSIIRIARLAKLARVFRASRILGRWQQRVSLTYGMQTLLKGFVITFIAMHWSACAIRLASDIERANCRNACFLDQWQRTCEDCHCQDDLDRQRRGVQWETSAGADVLAWYNEDKQTVHSLLNQQGNVGIGINPNDCFEGYVRIATRQITSTTTRTSRPSSVHACAGAELARHLRSGMDRQSGESEGCLGQYAAAQYWSITVLKGTDFQAINLSEYVVSIVLMILGGCIYSL